MTVLETFAYDGKRKNLLKMGRGGITCGQQNSAAFGVTLQ